MRFSENWLRSWVNPDISTTEMCEQLTMAGLEVDSVEAAAGDFTDVVVARVEAVEKHPDAEKLSVCRVDDGSEILQIVCGAANVRTGLIVPLARLGAVLPGDFRIKPAKLRGVESSGMLCSEKELGLADSAAGLMELPGDAPLGLNLRDYLELDDMCIEIDLTPNRGDCLSIAGIAREIGVLNQCDVNAHAQEPGPQQLDEVFPVEIRAPEACSQYAGRIVADIDTMAATPLWMVERLRRSGIRSLGAVVDITNYVMLELGQPMHAFDLAQLHGRIIVRFAEPDESITLLDGKNIELDSSSLVIADDAGALALAGIMGGENSGVCEETRSIFLESAFFAPEVIAGKARSYGLQTDSSHRFERGVDPQLQVRALERATELVLQICGGRAGPVTRIKTASHPVERAPIELRESRINRLLGISMAADEVVDILQRLGMEVKRFDDHWLVTSPGFRFDIAIESDLLEELVRVHGYNNVPRTQPAYRASMRAISEYFRPLTRLRSVLVDRGYYEAITYSFVDPELLAVVDPGRHGVKLANPLSAEMSVMRTTLWPGLLQVVRHNMNRQHERVRLFETGLCFLQHEDGLKQIDRIAGAVCGTVEPEQWAQPAREVDFYDIKADVEALLKSVEGGLEFHAQTHPALHPGQSAGVTVDGEAVGWIGALHPRVVRELDLGRNVFVFELELDAVQRISLPAFSPLSRYPEVRRDLAIVIDQAVEMQQIENCIREGGSDLLTDIRLFDVYTGKGVAQGRKSIAFGLILQEFSRTLTDQEVDAEVERIVSALKLKFAATLRE
jgi:phenylalanyl-tRNA synthetase beta chain